MEKIGCLKGLNAIVNLHRKSKILLNVLFLERVIIYF